MEVGCVTVLRKGFCTLGDGVASRAVAMAGRRKKAAEIVPRRVLILFPESRSSTGIGARIRAPRIRGKKRRTATRVPSVFGTTMEEYNQ